jgi:hypothetical protein
MTFEIDSIYNRTLTKENNSFKEKRICQKSNRSITMKSNRVKRVLKRYLKILFFETFFFL